MAQLEERDRVIPGVETPGDALGIEGLEAMEAEPIELPDGSALIPEPEEPARKPSRHFDNLVKDLEVGELSLLTQDIADYIDRDKEARERRDATYKEAIERSGLSGEAPGGAKFAGASRVVHPMIAEACVDFAARLMKEVYPPDGPVKTKIWGRSTEDKEDRANRKKTWLNWQLTSNRGRQALRGFREELEQMLTQLPLGGCEFLKLWHDGKRFRVEFVPVDNVLVPYAATYFYTSPRITHWQKLTQQEFESRIASGLYEEPTNSSPPSNVPEVSASEEARQKVEGKEPSSYNEDGLRDVYEVQLSRKLSVDGSKESLPYVVVWDEAANEILAVRRNWAERDPLQERLNWFFKFGLIPWSGAYDLGIWHLIGTLSVAATGALRALLDSAHINNAPSALKLKGRGAGETIVPEIGEITEIDASPNVDDIRKVAMPFPFNPPSPVLFNLLEWVTAAGKGVLATAEEKIADASNNMPVGTTLALIEQGSLTFSAVHARIHNSMAMFLEGLSRLNSEYLDEEDAAQELGGDATPTRKDFLPPHDISPVSDPNIFSDAQRYAQNQGLLQLSVDQRVKYNVHALHRRVLKTMKIEDVDAILPPLASPQRLDAVAENVITYVGTPLIAFPDQEQLAHLKIHLDFILSPVGGGNTVIGPKIVPPLIDHCGQHLVYFYLQKMQEVGRDVASRTGLPQDETLAAAVSELAKDAMLKDLRPLLESFSQAIQVAQGYAPQAPMDPRADALLKAALAETERKKALDAQTIELKKADMAAKQEFEKISTALEMQTTQQQELTRQQEAARKDELQMLMAQIQAKTEQDKNNQDNVTKLVTELLKNHEDNITELIKARTVAEQGTETEDAGEEEGEEEKSKALFGELEKVLARAQAAESTRVSETILQGLTAVLQSVRAPRVLEYDDNGDPIRSVIDE